MASKALIKNKQLNSFFNVASRDWDLCWGHWVCLCSAALQCGGDSLHPAWINYTTLIPLTTKTLKLITVTYIALPPPPPVTQDYKLIASSKLHLGPLADTPISISVLHWLHGSGVVFTERLCIVRSVAATGQIRTVQERELSFLPKSINIPKERIVSCQHPARVYALLCLAEG